MTWNKQTNKHQLKYTKTDNNLKYNNNNVLIK